MELCAGWEQCLCCSIIHSPFLHIQKVNPGGACHTRKAALWRQLHIIIIFFPGGFSSIISPLFLLVQGVWGREHGG